MSNQKGTNEPDLEVDQGTRVAAYETSVPADAESGIEPSQDPQIDADDNGHLATGLFMGVIAVLLVLIYAFASAV